MRVKIFCDVFATSGLGHLRRCEKILAHIEKLCKKKSELSLYPYNGKNMASFLESVSSDDFLIVDSYLLNPQDFYVLKEKVRSLMVIEDKEHSFYPKNTTIMNFTLNALKHYHHLSKDYRYYLGVEFYPIDVNFIYERPVDLENKEVLITLGGSEHKILVRIVQILENNGVNLHIISANAQKSSQKNTHYYSHLSPLEFSALMKFCGCAISAAGQTLYELALTKTPSLILPIASNQIIQSKEFEQSGIFKQTSLKTLARDFKELQEQRGQKWIKNLAFGSKLESALKEFLEI
ncbi:hypothetical protein [Helicobacter cetorum]|uniref:CMP-N-acetylneuraminic acid synthetase NeuA n=1 Tax=Helicobacter cetorum (strain ATCC BAA-540 / CCUG 52418 / MIT 99-5656) TaxID=1163745 RepID=I0ER86_HELCM|nr:hypothetical protein [Helicobacter cetorum]AFI05455.1 CMP-N-acetylneuraminic acid synthetase NeuA [Helicobacter cetorum MIT 99-5656]